LRARIEGRNAGGWALGTKRDVVDRADRYARPSKVKTALQRSPR
jgi:hypothetical protein